MSQMTDKQIDKFNALEVQEDHQGLAELALELPNKRDAGDALEAAVRVRLDVFTRELLSTWGVPEDAHRLISEICRIVSISKTPEKLISIVRTLDWDRIIPEANDVRYAARYDGSLPARCFMCANLFPADGLVQVDGHPSRAKTACKPCAEDFERGLAERQKKKRKTNLKSAIAVARRNRTQATLTSEQWEKTVAFFNNCCAYCGIPAWVVVEHVIPTAHEGGTVYGNCVPACGGCNSRKGRRSLDQLKEFDPKRILVLRNWIAKTLEKK
jgi:hypothetical protein